MLLRKGLWTKGNSWTCRNRPGGCCKIPDKTKFMTFIDIAVDLPVSVTIFNVKP
jgi:hypothetical protein